MSRRAIVLGALGAVVVAGGVLAAVLLPGQGDLAAQPLPPAPGEPGSPWKTLPADVIELRTGPGEYLLTVRIEVPGPDPSCVREPHVDHVTETAGTITADVLYSTKGTCPEKVPVELRLSTTSPVANRTVTLNSAQPWHRSGDVWAH